MKTDKQIACNNWEKIGMLKERKRILELIEDFTALKNTISGKELKKEVEK